MRSKIVSFTLESGEIICATSTCVIDRFTLRNGDKVVGYDKTLGD